MDLGDTLIEQKVDSTSPLSQLELVAFPDSKPAMNELKAYGYLIAIVSNTFQSSANDVAKALEKLGLMEYVDAIVTSYDVGVEKPHPKVYLTALEQL
jgi:FMN phosphatase YigB (HAD superfamily)